CLEVARQALDRARVPSCAVVGEAELEALTGDHRDRQRIVRGLDGVDVVDGDAAGGVAALLDRIVLEDEEGFEEGLSARDGAPGLDVDEGRMLELTERGLPTLQAVEELGDGLVGDDAD